MIALDNGDKVRGDAAVAAEVDYLLFGFVGTTATQLADGQLPNAIGDLYTAAAGGIGVSSIILVNTGAVPRAVNLYLTPAAGAARRLIDEDYSLAAGKGLWTDGKSARLLDTGAAGVSAHDILDGSVHQDSVADAVTEGSIIVGNATPKWDELVIGAPEAYLRSDATAPAWALIPADEVVNTPAGGIAATDVQAAINELDGEKVGTHSILDGSVHPDSVADVVTRGSLIVGNSTPKWDELDVGGVGEVLTSDGTDVAWAAPTGAGGLYTDYIHIRDEKASGAGGGGFTQGAWRTRVLNVELSDTGGDAALAANQITLQAGTYRMLISCPARGVDTHKARLWDTGNGGSLILMGTSEYTPTGSQSRSFIVGRFTIAGAKVLEVQHYCQTTVAGNGFGSASAFGVIEVYTEVELWKEA